MRLPCTEVSHDRAAPEKIARASRCPHDLTSIDVARLVRPRAWMPQHHRYFVARSNVRFKVLAISVGRQNTVMFTYTPSSSSQATPSTTGRTFNR